MKRLLFHNSYMVHFVYWSKSIWGSFMVLFEGYVFFLKHQCLGGKKSALRVCHAHCLAFSDPKNGKCYIGSTLYNATTITINTTKLELFFGLYDIT